MSICIVVSGPVYGDQPIAGVCIEGVPGGREPRDQEGVVMETPYIPAIF